MQDNGSRPDRMPALGCAALVIVAGVAGLWFTWSSDEPPAPRGVVLQAPAAATAPVGPVASMPVRAATLPTPADTVVAHVRQTYPLLTDVAFGCDAQGCAVTATIPPPTDEAFLQKRQEMLLGGLARTLAADGYRALGSVHMEEVDDNLFHIRASVVQQPAF